MSNFLKNLHPLLKRGKNENDNKDPNYAIINMFEDELNKVEQDTIESKIQSSLKQATGKYLDIYGDLYGVYRQDNQDDEAYRNDIITYVLLNRGTNKSIIDAIKRFLKDPNVYVDVYEPLTNIFYLNKSKLNGQDHMMGEYYHFAVIDVTIGSHFDTNILNIINQFKPAGVKIVFTYDGGHTNHGSLILDVYNDIQPNITTYQETDRLTGYGKTEYGHIGLLLGKEDYYSNKLFITNNSKINSTDILSGSTTQGRKYYNVVMEYSNEYTPYPSSLPVYMLNVSGNELDNSIYMQTSKRDNLYYYGTITKPLTYYYFNIDMNQTMLSKGINLSTIPSGNQVQYISDYLGSTTLDLDIKAYTPPTNNVKATLQVYDFTNSKWVTINTTNLSLEMKNIGNQLGNLVDYINPKFLFICRIRFESTTPFDVQIRYFDISYFRLTPDVYSIKYKHGTILSLSEKT